MTTSRLLFGILFLVIGTSAITGIDIFHYIVPVIFILIGLRILTGKSWRCRHDFGSTEIHEDDINEVAIFSGSDKHVVSSQFTGGKAVAVFSGMELDLTGAKTKAKLMNLELVAVFGGLKVSVPKDWKVTTDAAGILGGFVNHTKGSSDSAPRLHVKGAAVFGGVDIVN